MKTIVVHNEKGGVGKTETARWLALSLASRGRVLLIDSDPQADLTCRMNRQPEDEMLALYKNEPVAYMVIDGIHLIPSKPGLEAVNEMLARRRFGQLGVLAKQLEQFAPDYAYCVIDTPTTFEYLTLNAYCAADWLVVPTRPNDDDLAGVDRTLATLRQLAESGVKTPTPVGLIATAYRTRVEEHRITVDLLRRPAPAWKWYAQALTWPALLGLVPQAEGKGAKAKRGLAYRNIVDELLCRMDG